MSDNVEKNAPEPKPGGVKYDHGKPACDLLPPLALLKVADVLGFGLRKYSRHNWIKAPGGRDRYVAAAIRHLLQYQAGEDLDTESGLPHLAHAACCVLFALEMCLRGIGTDERLVADLDDEAGVGAPVCANPGCHADAVCSGQWNGSPDTYKTCAKHHDRFHAKGCFPLQATPEQPPCADALGPADRHTDKGCPDCDELRAKDVPAEVHESGWQWRPVNADSAYAPPFGTIRKCTRCGCLVAGGPGICNHCATRTR